MPARRVLWLSLAILGGLVLAAESGLLAHTTAQNPPPAPPVQVYFPLLVLAPTPTPTSTPTPTPTPTPAPSPTPTLAPEDWLAWTNYFRALGNLPPLSETAAWSEGAWLHSRYMVKNDWFTHDEDPDNPWYTPEGAVAGRNGLLLVSISTATTDAEAIAAWMRAPLHALGILDSTLLSVGYGSYREAIGVIQMGATMDVTRGHAYDPPPGVQFPVLWPADGTLVPLTNYGGEIPDPLTSCPGYTDPVGLPLIVQIGSGDRVPNVTAHTFRQDGTALEHCVFDETSYVNPDPDTQRMVRNMLDARDAIILIPRAPLIPGKTYNVSLTVNGNTYTWSFTVTNPLDRHPLRPCSPHAKGHFPTPNGRFCGCFAGVSPSCGQSTE